MPNTHTDKRRDVNDTKEQFNNNTDFNFLKYVLACMCTLLFSDCHCLKMFLLLYLSFRIHSFCKGNGTSYGSVYEYIRETEKTYTCAPFIKDNLSVLYDKRGDMP